MQFTSLFTIAAVAATAFSAALPTSSSEQYVCNGNQKPVCCNQNGVLGLLMCSILANNCDGGNAYCCDINQTGLVNLANCGQIKLI